MPGETSRHYIHFAALCPQAMGDETWTVRVSRERLLAQTRISRGRVMESAHILPEVLASPLRVWEGLRRDEDEDRYGNGWMCYCGRPSRRYDQNGQSFPPRPNRVFLVFLNTDMVAYNWRWEECDPSDPNVPKNCVDRFRRSIYERPTTA